MGFDIALVGGCGLELALDDHVGLGEAVIDVAMAELITLRHVGGGLGLGSTPLVNMSSCRIGRIGAIGLDVDDVGQDVVVDLDQLERLAGAAALVAATAATAWPS